MYECFGTAKSDNIANDIAMIIGSYIFWIIMGLASSAKKNIEATSKWILLAVVVMIMTEIMRKSEVVSTYSWFPYTIKQ